MVEAGSLTAATPVTPWTEEDARYIRLALEEAQAAYDIGEVPVGALVVSAKGEILGRGYNRTIIDHDPTAHAEICLLYTSPSPRDLSTSRMPSSA